MLAGKIAEINNMSLGMYKRTLSGYSSTFDLESALEVHQLLSFSLYSFLSSLGSHLFILWMVAHSKSGIL